MEQAFQHINYWAVIAAAVSNFAIGFLWYSPFLLGKTWGKENGFTQEFLNKGNPVKIFGFSFLWSLVWAFNLAMFLGDEKTDAGWGMTAGFLAGFGWVAMGFFVVGLFERKSAKLMLINGGYATVALTIMGLILGIWR